MRIVTDLMGFLRFKGASAFHMDMEMTPEKSVITVSAPVPGLANADVDQISRILNVPRQREVEQNYWNVSGEEGMDAELTLAGVMTDSADVKYEGGVLTVTAERCHFSTLE